MKNTENYNSRIKLPEILNEQIDIESIQKKCLITYDKKEMRPKICLEIRQDNKLYRLFTYKNFSVIAGRQKSRKTFFTALLMEAAVISNQYRTIVGHCQGRTNIIFDTEQGRFDASMNNWRVVKLCNLQQQPDNLITYALRSLNIWERMEFIEYVIKKTKQLGLVVIDGIRDLVTSINDEDQATEISTKLMQWTEDYDCHISVVLHLNKSDEGNLRGHLGTELQNKAEAVIEVQKLKDFSDYSVIKCRDMRSIEFNPFAMYINTDYLPVIDMDFMNNIPEERECKF